MSRRRATHSTGRGPVLARRAILAAALTLAAAAPTASADTTLNIILHGNQAPGVPWATTPGILPADTQAKMYDRITPLFRNITDDVLKPSTDGSGFYKSAALLPERRVSTRARRRQSRRRRSSPGLTSTP